MKYAKFTENSKKLWAPILAECMDEGRERARLKRRCIIFLVMKQGLNPTSTTIISQLNGIVGDVGTQSTKRRKCAFLTQRDSHVCMKLVCAKMRLSPLFLLKRSEPPRSPSS